MSGTAAPATDASVSAEDYRTMHDRLADTRARVYRESWSIDLDDHTDARDRRVTQWAIGRLPVADAGAKDRRLLHFLESSLDGFRRQCCTATIPTIARRTDLSETQVRARVATLVRRERIQPVSLDSGRSGYRVILSAAERQAADRELRGMWRRTPRYSEWLSDALLPTRFENELRLLWTRELWRASLPGFVKSAALELSQFVDRTGDAPFCAVTYARLSQRTGYSTERMRQAVDLLRHGRWVHVTTRLGRGDRGAGMEVRLRVPRLASVMDEYRAHVLTLPFESPPEVGTKTRNAVATVEVGIDEPPSM